MADGDDERPQYQQGVGTINGTQFHWGSGTPGKYWSIPYGDYPVTPSAPTGAWAHSVGAIPINNNIIPDPVLHRNRVGIMVHPSSSSALDALYTQGCFAVDPQDWPGVRQQILDESAKSPLYLHVAPGGVAAFTHTKTLGQAGAPPASQSSDAAQTAAAPAPFTMPDNAPAGMRNNNPLNIKYVPGAPYAGLVGPSKNTDQGDPQMVFSSPEAGWSAAYTLLNRKYGSGMTTPAAIIAGQGGWTPGNMQAAANVAKSAGIGVNDDIGFNDPAKAAKFMRALVTQEQGGAGSAYSDSMIANAVAGKALPTAPTSATPAATPGTTINTTGAGAGGALPGFGTKDASDQFLKNADNFDKALGGKGFLGSDQQGQQTDMRPPQIMQGPGLRNYPGPAGVEAQARQLEPQLTHYSPGLYGQSLNSQPLSWSTAPPPAPQWLTAAGPQGAQQGLGTSLNSLQMAGGLSPYQLQMMMNPMMLDQGGSYG